jgi:arginase
MPLAAVAGRCWQTLCRSVPGFRPVPESQIVLVGTRALDTKERDLLEHSAATIVSGPQIAAHGLDAALVGALERLAGDVDGVYLHIDLDVLDPSAGRANEYVEPGGLTMEDLVHAVQMVGDAAPISCATLSAYDPTYDTDGRVARAGLEALAAVAAAAGRPGHR